MDESTREGLIPTTNGTGAVKNYFRFKGSIGIKTCYHLKGYNKPKNASVA
jgi:hypothetical protein